MLYYNKEKTEKLQGGNYFSEQESQLKGQQQKFNQTMSAGYNDSSMFSQAENTTPGFMQTSKPTNANTAFGNTADISKNISAGGSNKMAMGNNLAQSTAKVSNNFGNSKGVSDAVKNNSTSGMSNASIYTGVAQMGSKALLGLKNKDQDDTTYTGGDKAADIGSAALSGAATGAGLVASSAIASTAAASVGTAVGIGAATGAAAGTVVPVIGTVIGAVVGIGLGLLKMNKNKKKAEKAGKARDVKVAKRGQAEAMKNALDKDKKVASTGKTHYAGTANKQTAPAGAPGGYGTNEYQYRDGGTFNFQLKKNFGEDSLKVLSINELNKKPPMKFKKGGRIKAHENIIPNGVLHEEKNKLGDKGMPVVMCKADTCVKKYEIEKDEMIFTLATTKNVEKLARGKAFKELGKFVKLQILDNTHSFTGKYKDLNNYKKNETIFN